MSHYFYGNINFLIIIHFFMPKNMPIMPALCLMLRLYHYAQNYAGIMYLTLQCRVRTVTQIHLLNIQAMCHTSKVFLTFSTRKLDCLIKKQHRRLRKKIHKDQFSQLKITSL